MVTEKEVEPIAESLAIGWRASSVSGWGVWPEPDVGTYKTGSKSDLGLTATSAGCGQQNNSSLEPVLQRQNHLLDYLQKLGSSSLTFRPYILSETIFCPPLKIRLSEDQGTSGLSFSKTRTFPAQVWHGPRNTISSLRDPRGIKSAFRPMASRMSSRCSKA